MQTVSWEIKGEKSERGEDGELVITLYTTLFEAIGTGSKCHVTSPVDVVSSFLLSFLLPLSWFIICFVVCEMCFCVC